MKPKLRWLLYLLLVAALFTTVTLSRYSAAVSGEATATVAVMDMSTSSIDFTTEDLKPGGSSSLSFCVVNYTGNTVSDVSQSYSISVSSTGNLPLSFDLAGDKSIAKNTVNTAGHLGTTADTKDGATWSGGSLEHSFKTAHTYTLTMSWPKESASPALADEIDLITVTVNSEQEIPSA